MSSPLSRYENTVATTANLPSLGLPGLAVEAVRIGGTVLCDGHRVRLGSPIERLVRTPRAAVSCSSASLRERVAAKVRARSAALLAERQRAADDASQHPAAPVASPEPPPELSADEQLAALIKNPPSPEQSMVAALKRDAAKGSSK